jgi:hypothetical protein
MCVCDIAQDTAHTQMTARRIFEQTGQKEKKRKKEEKDR